MSDSKNKCAATAPLPVELPVLEELLPVDVESAELVSPGRVVTPGVVKPVDDAAGLLQASPRRQVATARRAGVIAGQYSAKPRRSQRCC